MPKKVVIAGSAALQEKVRYWKSVWEERGYEVTNAPFPIPKEQFLDLYPKVHQDFFWDITQADVLFVMNEDKNGIVGYIGAETFAECCFGVAQKSLYHKNLDIVLLKMPDKSVQSYDEIALWLTLGWIKFYQDYINET